VTYMHSTTRGYLTGIHTANQQLHYIMHTT
jgi:hypothetical protein